MTEYAKNWTVRFVGSMERGHERGNLHIQCVGTFGLRQAFESTTKLNAALRKHIRDRAQLRHKDGVKIIVKPLGGKQTFEGKIHV